MGHIRMFEESSKEHKALEYAAALMNEKAEALGYKPEYYVGDCYFDCGQDWMWTTILYGNHRDGFQALYPVAHEEFTEGRFDKAGELVERQTNILHK